MVRPLALAVTVAAIVVSTANAATGPRGSMRLTVTGEIRQLGPGSIVVGNARCAVPSKLSASVGRFVIGDPVRITCLGETLSGVRYSPEVAANQSSKAGSTPPSIAPPTTTASAAPTCGLACAKRVAVTFGIGYRVAPSGASTSTTGTISDISDQSITVGGTTCSFPSFTAAMLGQTVRVGDDVTMMCTGGALVHLASLGTVSR